MDADMEMVRQLFLVEAEEGLATMEEALVGLEARPDDPAPLQEIFRIVHTIKGNAGILGFDNVGEYAHLLEDALELFRSGAAPITPTHITTLLLTVDAMRGLLRAASNGRTSHVRASDKALIARLMPGGGIAGAAPGGADGGAGRGAVGDAAGTAGRTLRVAMRRLDTLLNLTGEITVARGRLLHGPAARRAGDDSDAVEALDRLLSDLQTQVMEMRLVPLGPVFRNHLRTVRDLAAAHGKLVRLTLEGEDVEVDASIVEHLRDPLTHMVRNATDHGVEYPAARHEAGKDPCATVTLRARHEGATVVVEVSDDGMGLDRDRILARAVASGLVAPGAVLTDAEIHRLIFEPGLSTAEHVTEVSGRGVGMDVVRRNVDTLRGSMEVSTVRGKGTTISIRLPLTVAIIDGFTVAVGDESYVVPLEAVTECLELPVGERRQDEVSGVLNLRGTVLPYVRLRHLFALPPAATERENVIVLRHGSERAGLVVDRLVGQGQSVVKPLDKLFDRVPCVSGSTILGNGRVALIVDVAAILADARRSDASGSPSATAA